MDKKLIFGDNTSTPTNKEVEEKYSDKPPSPTSPDAYKSLIENSEEPYKERHLLKVESDFRKEFSTQVLHPDYPNVIVDSNTQPEESERIFNLLKDATTGEGKERLESIEKNGYFRSGSKRKKTDTSSYVVSAKHDKWVDVSKPDGNMRMELQNDSIDNRSKKRPDKNGKMLYYHYEKPSKRTKIQEAHTEEAKNYE